jgi:hypothetical protein
MSNSATKVETTIAELVAAFPAAFTLDRLDQGQEYGQPGDGETSGGTLVT